ncbi:MAG: ATP-binding cassette domain-containing protein [Phycisphaerales bacterium]
MATIELKDISKRFGEVEAVRGVSLSIADGEFVVLVGPSGCGKSTLLRMIAGLEEVTAGTLTIGGRVMNDVPARDRDIAFVFQNYALYPHLSVRSNLAFGLERRRSHPSVVRSMLSSEYRAARRDESERIRAKVALAAETLGLVPYLERKPRELSGGQRQRVAVGRAIVREPKVFLFDEPLSNLDAKLRVEMRSELRDLHRRLKATMVYVTHDQEEAMGLGDRIVVLKDGVAQQVGTPDDVYARPANRFVASFVGMPSINLIEGRLHRGDGVERFVAESISVDLPAGRSSTATPGSITFGVRPDRLRVGDAATSASWRGAATVDAVERLGDRADVVLRVGPHRLIARCDPTIAPREGTTCAIGIDARDGHLFGPDGARVG